MAQLAFYWVCVGFPAGVEVETSVDTVEEMRALDVPVRHRVHVRSLDRTYVVVETDLAEDGTTLCYANRPPQVPTAAAERPSWVHCVSTDEYDGPDRPKNRSWCGRNIGHEWHFVNAGHAALNARKSGSVVACRACVEALVMVLRSG
jgi:hypothetical protein